MLDELSNICPTCNIQMVLEMITVCMFFVGVDVIGYEYNYLFSLYLFYFYIWKNFYFATKENIKIGV